MQAYYPIKYQGKNNKETLYVPVQVTPCKGNAFGRKLCEVTPIGGKGSWKVNATKIIIEYNETN